MNIFDMIGFIFVGLGKPFKAAYSFMLGSLVPQSSYNDALSNTDRTEYPGSIESMEVHCSFSDCNAHYDYSGSSFDSSYGSSDYSSGSYGGYE